MCFAVSCVILLAQTICDLKCMQRGHLANRLRRVFGLLLLQFVLHMLMLGNQLVLFIHIVTLDLVIMIVSYGAMHSFCKMHLLKHQMLLLFISSVLILLIFCFLFLIVNLLFVFTNCLQCFDTLGRFPVCKNMRLWQLEGHISSKAEQCSVCLIQTEPLGAWKLTFRSLLLPRCIVFPNLLILLQMVVRMEKKKSLGGAAHP